MISSIIQDNETQHSQYSCCDRPKLDKWGIELVIKFNGISRTARIEVYVLIHMSYVIITCTLKLSSHPPNITHNLQVTIIVGENNRKKKPMH